MKPNYKFPFGKYSPAYRLKNSNCELCGAQDVGIIMHQVRKITEIEPDTPWNIVMIKNNRKTLATCEICYGLIKMQG